MRACGQRTWTHVHTPTLCITCSNPYIACDAAKRDLVHKGREQGSGCHMIASSANMQWRAITTRHRSPLLSNPDPQRDGTGIREVRSGLQATCAATMRASRRQPCAKRTSTAHHTTPHHAECAMQETNDCDPARCPPNDVTQQHKVRGRYQYDHTTRQILHQWQLTLPNQAMHN